MVDRMKQAIYIAQRRLQTGLDDLMSQPVDGGLRVQPVLERPVAPTPQREVRLAFGMAIEFDKTGQ